MRSEKAIGTQHFTIKSVEKGFEISLSFMYSLIFCNFIIYNNLTPNPYKN